MPRFVDVTPSGKGPEDENFPVASRLLPVRLRKHVMIFYAFARAADDIADSPYLTPDHKIQQLERFSSGLLMDSTEDQPEQVQALRMSLAATGNSPQHGIDLIAAFMQDARKTRYRCWDDLLGYCRLSAAPVGRYLLDLHGESSAAYPAADALCHALQILNHLQDCQDDYIKLDRVYLPEIWFAEAHVDISVLAGSWTIPGLRYVLDHCLDGVDSLLQQARSLPCHIVNTGLAAEAAVIIAIADSLMQALRRRDPLAKRVELNLLQKVGAASHGLMRFFFARQHAWRKRSRSLGSRSVKEESS